MGLLIQQPPLDGPLSHILPLEADADYYRQLAEQSASRRREDLNQLASAKLGPVRAASLMEIDPESKMTTAATDTSNWTKKPECLRFHCIGHTSWMR